MATFDINVVWNTVAKRSSKNRFRQISPLRDFLRLQTNSHANLLSGFSDSGNCDNESALALECLILDHYRGGQIDRAVVAAWLGLIYAALALIAKTGLPVAQVRLALEIVPEPSPFCTSKMESGHRVKSWQSHLRQWIVSLKGNTQKEWAGALICSAAIHGLLIDAAKLQHLYENLRSGFQPSLSTMGEYYDFDLPWRGLGNHHLQRWLLDPITAMLIYRVPPETFSEEHRPLFGAITDFLREAGVEEEVIPASLSDFVEACANWWLPNTEPLITGVARRKLAVHSPHPSTWARHHGAIVDGAAELKAVSVRSEERDLLDHDDDFDVLFPWLSESGEILARFESTDDRQSAHRAVTDSINEVGEDDSGRIYLGWLLDELAGNNAAGKGGLTIKTIRRRFLAAVPPLLGLLGNDDPASFDTQNLADIYSELTTDPAMVNAKDMANGLRDFHGYLVRRHRKKHLANERDIFGEDGALRPVDARIISFDEYEQAQKWIDRRLAIDWDQEDIDVSKIVLMLGFCAGLRRMEILGLRLKDIQEWQGTYVIVRRHSLRRLKTDNSKRILPIHVLLNRKDIEILRHWINKRRTACGLGAADRGGDQDFLFEQFVQTTRDSWVNKVCERVCDALRAVTGDAGLFLHHLRHSFASWCLLRLKAAEFPGLCERFSHLPITQSVLQASSDFRADLLGQSASGGSTRSLAFAVGRLLGHGSPMTSMNHYIHTVDLLLREASVRRMERDIPGAVLVAASGLPSSIAYERLNAGSGYRSIVACVRDGIHRSEIGLRDEKNALRKRGRPPLPPVVERPGWVRFETILQAVRLLLVCKKDLQYVADWTGLTQSQIKAIFEQVSLLQRHYGNDGVPGRPRAGTETETFLWLETRMASLYQIGMERLVRLSELHLDYLNWQRHDVVFTKKEGLRELSEYLKLLALMGVQKDEMLVVIRQVATERLELPTWVSGALKSMLPTTLKRVPPQVIDKVSSYEKWIGIAVSDAKGHILGKRLLNAILTARLVVAAQKAK